MNKRWLKPLILLILFLSQSAAQNESELDLVGQKLSRHLEMKMPGWKHKRGEPIRGSKNVLIEFWSFRTGLSKYPLFLTGPRKRRGKYYKSSRNMTLRRRS